MEAPANRMGFLFERWRAELADWRWGTLLHSVDESLKLEIALRNHWSLAKYVAHGEEDYVTLPH